MFDAESFIEGKILLVDKPIGWTSFDVVNKLRYQIRYAYNIKKIKVGHAGTLDPLATGLLLICTGKNTKKLDTFSNLEKSYSGTFRLGATTPSYDAETEIDNYYPTDHIDNQLIEKTRLEFLGKQEQYPPIFSAIKVDGVALYKSARAGKSVEVKPRDIEIMAFEITKIDEHNYSFFTSCSKGTYIRSLIFDFGRKLNSGAYLTSLKRESIGEYNLQNAWNLEQLLSEIK
ncbi:MAG: tRNA pseudouridine(55) synthase TruB [Saprospiraceae bacterium]|nr:tRNA pseudouridine(55) synthase TruB [Saprospiraceae bacterium]